MTRPASQLAMEVRNALDRGLLAWRTTTARELFQDAFAALAELERLAAGTQRAEDGAALIAAERQRQIDSEGWTPDHDSTVHDDGALVMAACCYATPPEIRADIMLSDEGAAHVNEPGTGYDPRHWPVGWEWKPTPHDRVRELVKAGALIAAEIDRLRRAALAAAESNPGTTRVGSSPADPSPVGLGDAEETR